MKANRLGCLSLMGILAAPITALMIAAFALVSGRSMFSPGALNAKPGVELGGVTSHAVIGGNCKACHTAPWETDTMDNRCLICHIDVAVEMLTPSSVHGRMMQIDPNTKCRTCHPEHHGADALLTILDGRQFPHDAVRFSLRSHQLTAGKEPFLCADCHKDDITRFDVLTCRTCHISMDMAFMVEHQVAFGENCLECHDGVERFGKNFDHNQFAFKLLGKHAVVKCAQCHMQAVTLTALQTTSQDCFSCHAKDDAHDGSLGINCVSCHSTDRWNTGFDHNRSDFKLTGAHAQVTCEKCHVNGIFKGTPKDCFSCHRQNDPHMGQFGAACETCHTTDAWMPAPFDHNTTGFALIGSHGSVDCKSCHINGIFANTPRDCFSCHSARDIHQGQYGRNCGLCHQPTVWSTNANFDHNATAFPLMGNHVSVSCKSCHGKDVFNGTPTVCSSCHAKDDVHNGQLGTNCSICHTPTGWSIVNFDHNSSAFPLTGAHAQTACNQCHLSGQYIISTDCASCHAEPAFHVGAFGRNCAQCHTTITWLPATFIGTHPTALGQNFLDHHGAVCKTCHTATVYDFTCLACHETNPLSPPDGTSVPSGMLILPGRNHEETITILDWEIVTEDYGKPGSFPWSYRMGRSL